MLSLIEGIGFVVCRRQSYCLGLIERLIPKLGRYSLRGQHAHLYAKQLPQLHANCSCIHQGGFCGWVYTQVEIAIVGILPSENSAKNPGIFSMMPFCNMFNIALMVFECQ